MLGAQYRLIAPDYPRIRAQEAPDGFTYRFDRLADITEGFVQRLGLSRFVMYIFDFGAPVGFRLAERHPEWIAGLICRTATPTSRACRTQPATSSPCDPRSRAPFFPEAGARAYLRDLPDAELYLLDTGHFALEDKLPEIAPLIADFLDRTRA